MPSVGGVIRVSILRSVDLPAPFLPMKPTTSPSSTVNETSLSAQSSSERVVDVLEAERAPDGVRERVAKRLVPGPVLADLVALREPVGDDGAHIVSAKRGSARR